MTDLAERVERLLGSLVVVSVGHARFTGWTWFALFLVATVVMIAGAELSLWSAVAPFAISCLYFALAASLRTGEQ